MEMVILCPTYMHMFIKNSYFSNQLSRRSCTLISGPRFIDTPLPISLGQVPKLNGSN